MKAGSMGMKIKHEIQIAFSRQRFIGFRGQAVDMGFQ